MFRAGLAVYLSLVLSAGPFACCGTPTRLRQWLAGLGGGNVREQAPALPSCCQHHSAESDRVPSSPARPNPPENAPCPCQHCCPHQPATAAPDPADISIQRHSTALQLVGADAPFVHDRDFSLADSQPYSFREGVGPPLSAQHLL